MRLKVSGALPSLCALMLGPASVHAQLPLGPVGKQQGTAVPANTSGPRNFEGIWWPEMGSGAGTTGGGSGPPGSGPPGSGAGGPPGGGPPGGAGGPPGGGPPGGGGGPEAITDARTQCAPKMRLNGGGGGATVLIVQSDRQMVLSGEENTGTFQNIYIGDTHPSADKLVPQPNGHSIGHWEGNTLVVDSVGYADNDGKDSGLHIVERFSKTGNALKIEITRTTRDGKSSQSSDNWAWRPDLQYNESICEEGFSRYQLSNGSLDNPNVPPNRKEK